MNIKLNLTFIGLILLLFTSCGEEEQKVKFVKSPIDKIITEYINYNNYSVILADMDYKEDTDKYYHKYKIIVQRYKRNLSKEALNDTLDNVREVKIDDTDWKEVSPIVFEDHINDLGMTIVSRKDGVLEKNTAPAGANNYVGNPRYGEWKTHSNGSSFWSFYGRYRFMSDIFFGPSYGYGGYYGYPRTVYYDYHGHYYGKKDYRHSGNDYTNSGGSFYSKTRNNGSTKWDKKSSAFKNIVNRRVQKSSSALKSRGYTSRKSYSKTYRNTNRYSSGYSSRSTSGGFGK